MTLVIWFSICLFTKGLLEDSRDKVYCGGKTNDADRFVDITVFKGRI